MSKNPILYGVVLLIAWLGFSPALQARFEMQDGRYDVDLSLSSATVRSFTSALTRQTGILFSYETDLANKELGDVSVHEKQVSLEKVLNQVFSGKGISWKMVNKTVVLTADSQAATGEKVTITGKVVDGFGEPLAGAGVLVKGSSYGVTTDLDGRYAIQVNRGATLRFSFIGFTEQEVRVGSSNKMRALKNPSDRHVGHMKIVCQTIK